RRGLSGGAPGGVRLGAVHREPGARCEDRGPVLRRARAGGMPPIAGGRAFTPRPWPPRRAPKAMRVLIVAKPHMRAAACVGGLALDNGHNVRLLLPNGANQPPNTAYEVGDVWELNYRPKRVIVAPHVEDVLVNSARKVGRQDQLTGYLLSLIRPW